MSETAQLLLVLLTGGGLGGLLGEVLRHRRERTKARAARVAAAHTIGLEDFRMFQSVWQAEMKRLHMEIAELRAEIVILSRELERLGADPLEFKLLAREGMHRDDEEEGK